MTIDADESLYMDNQWTIDAQVFCGYRFHRLSIFNPLSMPIEQLVNEVKSQTFVGIAYT